MLLSQSTQVAVTEYQRLGGLSNKHFVLTALEARSQRSGHQQGLVLEKDPPPSLQMKANSNSNLTTPEPKLISPNSEMVDLKPSGVRKKVWQCLPKLNTV